MVAVGCRRRGFDAAFPLTSLGRSMTTAIVFFTLVFVATVGYALMAKTRAAWTLALTTSRMLLIAIGINVICWIGFGQAVLTATALEGSETSADPIERLFMLVTNSVAVLYASTALLLCGAVYSFVLFRNSVKTLNDRPFDE